MNYSYFKDENTGIVYAYSDEQMAIVTLINSSRFDGKDNIPAVFFEIDETIKGLRAMTQEEIDAHLRTVVHDVTTDPDNVNWPVAPAE